MTKISPPLSAMVLPRSNRIEVEDLPLEVKGGEPMGSVPRDGEELRRMKWQLRRKAENEVERVFLIEALRRNRGNVSKTALDVGMDRRQLQNLIRKHRILARSLKATPRPAGEIENGTQRAPHG